MLTVDDLHKQSNMCWGHVQDYDIVHKYVGVCVCVCVCVYCVLTPTHSFALSLCRIYL